MKEEILIHAISKLNELNGFSCEKITNNECKFDFILSLTRGVYEEKFDVTVKSKIVPAQISGLKEESKNNKSFILIADYITTNAMELLRAVNISYIDTVGNMFIASERMYIFIQTNKTNREKLQTRNRAFGKAGLKVVYQLLVNPDYLNKPYRFIGEEAKVTIDTVGKVIHDLLKKKLIIRSSQKKYQFIDRKKIFEEWVTGFNRMLEPTLKKQRYRSLNEKTKIENLILPQYTYWAGTIAAGILTDYLITNDKTLYTSLPFHEIMKKLKIIPDEEGGITLIESFWKNDEKLKNTINPIIVYAELISSADPRKVEVANKIYKKYVENNL